MNRTTTLVNGLYSTEPLVTKLVAREGEDDAAAKLAAEKAEADRLAKEEADRKAAEDAKSKGKTSDAEAKLLKEVMEKKEALKKRETELQAANERLKAFEGIDPTKVKELISAQEKAEAERKKAEEEALAKRGEWDALKKQMNDAHSAELAKKEEALTAALNSSQTLQQQIEALTVGNAFGHSKFITEELALTPSKARVVYGSHFEFKDGQVIAFDKPAGTKGRTMLVDGKGEPLDFEAAIAKIVEADPDKDSLKKSKLKPGANSNTNANRGNITENQPELSGREKIKAGLNSKSK